MKAYIWICKRCGSPIVDGDDFLITYKGYMSGNTPCVHKRLLMLHWTCSAIHILEDQTNENINQP